MNLSPVCNVETITVARKQRTQSRENDKNMHDSACQTQEDHNPAPEQTKSPKTPELSDSGPDDVIQLTVRPRRSSRTPERGNYSKITQKQYETNERLIEAAMTEAERSF